MKKRTTTTTRTPNARIQAEALRAIFADLAEMRDHWAALLAVPGDQHAVDRITELHQSIMRWTRMYRAAKG